MAASLTLVSASPNALKYRYAYSGSGSQIADVLKAALVADAATALEGPSALMALLDATIEPAWDVLEKSGAVSLYATPTAQTNAAAQVSALFCNPAGAGLRLRVTGLGQAAGDLALVEVRFNHSRVR